MGLGVVWRQVEGGVTFWVFGFCFLALVRALAVLSNQIDGAVTYTAFAINNKAKVRALAVAMDKRHPLLPDVPTFRELGVDWVDGAYRGIGVPKSTPPEARKKLSDLFAQLNADPE